MAVEGFLVADRQLYKRLCPSVGPSVRWSVGPSVRHARVEKWENAPAHPSATGGCVSGLVKKVEEDGLKEFCAHCTDLREGRTNRCDGSIV